VCLLRGNGSGRDPSDGAETNSGSEEEGASGRVAAGALRLCIYGVVSSPALAKAPDRTAVGEPGTLLRAVPSPRNKHRWAQARVVVSALTR